MKPPSPGASFLSSNHGSKQEELLYLQTAAPDHAEPRRLPCAPSTLRATPGPPPALTDPRAWRRCRARPAPRDCAAVRGWRCAPSPAGPAAGQTLQAERGQGGIAARPGHPPPAQRPRSSAGTPEAAVPPSPRLPPAGDPPSPAAAGRAVPGVPGGSRALPSAFSLLLLLRRRLSSSCPARRNPAPRGARAAAAPRYWLARLSIKGGGARRPCCVTEHGGAPPSPPQALMTPSAPSPPSAQHSPGPAQLPQHLFSWEWLQKINPPTKGAPGPWPKPGLPHSI